MAKSLLHIVDDKGKEVKAHGLAILETKAVGSMIDRIGGHFVKGREMVQECAIQCLLHAEQYRDTTLMARLCTTLVKAKQRAFAESIVEWCTAFSPVGINLRAPDERTGLFKNGLRKPGKDKQYKPFDVPTAMKVPFWDDSIGNNAQRFNPMNMAAIFNLLNGGLTERITRAIDEGKPMKGDNWDHASGYAEAMKAAHNQYMTEHPLPKGIDVKTVVAPLEAHGDKPQGDKEAPAPERAVA